MAGKQIPRRIFGSFKVVCAWCGGLIRRDRAKDSLGMCLDCYHKEMSAYLRARQQTLSTVASER